jgi:isohexenylglutaconyl-CoA hydratase
MTYETILYEPAPPFAYITLNRPQKSNAMNFQMMDDLLACFADLQARRDVRAVVLTGAGGSFCSGGDLGDMLRIMATDDPDEQDRLVARLEDVLLGAGALPQVLIARVEGAALGGGLGLVCVSDIAIAATSAQFGMPEVRVGLAPALIAPHVIQRIGLTRARILMLTGARIDGVSAHEQGLIHEVCPPEILDECVTAVLNELRQCSPNALAAIKTLIREVTGKPLNETRAFRARMLNQLRLSEEGQEGMLAFQQKRAPRWAV